MYPHIFILHNTKPYTVYSWPWLCMACVQRDIKDQTKPSHPQMCMMGFAYEYFGFVPDSRRRAKKYFIGWSGTCCVYLTKRKAQRIFGLRSYFGTYFSWNFANKK